MKPLFLKFCGMKRSEDIIEALKLGADAVGFIFYPPSPRNVTAAEASVLIKEAGETAKDLGLEEIFHNMKKVGVFVNATVIEMENTARIAGLTTFQLHGDEEPAVTEALSLPVWKVLRLQNENDLDCFSRYSCSVFLLDKYSETAYGGTGESQAPELIVKALKEAEKKDRRIILAGGISPDNMNLWKEQIQKYSAFLGFDVNSGVEDSPGIKNSKRMRETALLAGKERRTS